MNLWSAKLAHLIPWANVFRPVCMSMFPNSIKSKLNRKGDVDQQTLGPEGNFVSCGAKSKRLAKLQRAHGFTPQRERVNTHDPCRGFIHAPQKRSTKTSFCTSTTPIPAEVRAGRSEIENNLEFWHLDTRVLTGNPDVSVEGYVLTPGSRGQIRNRKNLKSLHLDHADPRRGLRGQIRNRKKPRVFVPRPRRSPQRVAIPIDDQSPAPAP